MSLKNISSKVLGKSNSSSATTANDSTSDVAVESCTHTYVDSIIKEATCAESGMMESKCSKCGDTYNTEIPATGKIVVKSLVLN